MSSDISLVEAGGRRFCVKRALPRLKVAALWEAPVERNAAEAAYMRAVARWLPRAAPRILGEDPACRLVRDGLSRARRASACGRPSFSLEPLSRISPLRSGAIFAVIHARSAADPHIPAAFANDDTFEAIRLEPYLLAAARAHPDRADALKSISPP